MVSRYRIISRLAGKIFKKSYFFSYCPLKFVHRKLGISKTITARRFKLRLLIEDNELITW